MKLADRVQITLPARTTYTRLHSKVDLKVNSHKQKQSIAVMAKKATVHVAYGK